MLEMVVIFSGFASMSRWLMMNPSSFPDDTPKMHLLGLSFHWYSLFEEKNHIGISLPGKVTVGVTVY
jgi:hypothetical protein